MFPKKNLNFSVFGSVKSKKKSKLLLKGQKYFLKLSLKAKFKAYVGIYLTTFAKLPLHKEKKP